MTHLYLIRHADYIEELVDGKFPKRDLGLSPEGVSKAERLRDHLTKSGEIKPDVFISSAQPRALQTSHIIEPAVGKQAVPDRDFEEWRSGDDMLPTEEFMGAWDKLTDAERPYHRWVLGCETMLEFSTRVHAALNRVLTEHEGETILIVSHGAFIQVSFAYFFGYSLAVPQHAAADIQKTSITHWIQMPRRWILERSNDCRHLAV
jgi:probable phosphoglycerate mutase